MATIPDAGGARYAPRGVVRALLRFVVLAGLVIAGWLLGSGVGHANEDLGQPGVGLGQLASDPVDIAASSDGGSGTQAGLPPMVASAMHSVLSHASVPRLSVQPVAGLKPVVRAVAVPRPLTQVLTTVSRPMSAPTQHSAGIRSQQPAHELAAVPRTAPVVRPASATTPAATSAPAVAAHAPPHAPACAPAANPRDTALASDVLALGRDPASPIPTSPPDSSTASCMIGSASGGGGTKGSPDLAATESGTNAGMASTHRLGYLSGSDLPRSAAEQPSTSPD
ncbi:MAG: hypothetical protein ACRDQH_12755 [Pseudonocardiaceae bacterium]